MQKVFEEIKNALHKEDLEFMQQADLMACIDSIIDKVASDDKNGWVLVEKELPETGEMILGLSNDGDIWLYNFRRWDHESGGFYRNIINQYAQSTLPDDSVIAWQPLPDPTPNAYKPKKTNADRIRSMSDEELLDFICSIETYDDGSVKTIECGSALCSVTDIEKWLQAEVEE